MDEMGSAYLMAHGIGTSVADAMHHGNTVMFRKETEKESSISRQVIAEPFGFYLKPQ